MQTGDIKVNMSNQPIFKEVLDTTSMQKIPSRIYLIAKELEHYMKLHNIQELAGLKLRTYTPNFCGEPEFRWGSTGND